MRPTRSRWRMRCNACRRAGDPFHFTIPKPPSEYKKPVLCPTCKSDEVTDHEENYRRAQANRKKKTCYCHGVPHPHVTGTHRHCEHHELSDVPLTEDEVRDMQEVLNNPRRSSFR